MEVGVLLIFQNYLGRGRDEDVVKSEMRVAELAEPPGGPRQLRYGIVPITGGAGAPTMNEASDRIQQDLLRSVGAVELFRGSPSS